MLVVVEEAGHFIETQFEEGLNLFLCDSLAKASDYICEYFFGVKTGVLELVLEVAEEVFNSWELWTVARKEKEVHIGILNYFHHFCTLVAAEVVTHNGDRLVWVLPFAHLDQFLQVVGEDSVRCASLIDVLDQLYMMEANGGYHAHVVGKFRGLKPTGFADKRVT